MDVEGHARRIGHLLVNLQSLEFVLRAYLYCQADAPHVALDQGISLNSMVVGDTVGENALTDFSPLGRLIDR
jgi:hypothetical protein